MQRTTSSLLFIILLTWLPIHGFSQNKKNIDSLENALKKYESSKKEIGMNAPILMDSTKAILLNNIAQEYWDAAPDKATEYALECLAISEKIGFKKGIGYANYTMAVISENKGNYQAALDYYQKSLKIMEEIKNKKGIANDYNGIGAVYKHQGNYSEALNNYLSSLKIKEELGNKKGIAGSYNNIGDIYYMQKDFEQALSNYQNSLKIRIGLGDNAGISDSYETIGNIYTAQNNYEEALQNHLNSLKIREDIGDKRRISNSYINIGNVYNEQNKFADALKNYSLSLKIKEEIGDKYGIFKCNNSISQVYEKQGNLNEAIKYELKALAISKETGARELIKNAYMNLALFYAKQQNYKSAYDYHVLYKQVYDTIFNKENEKKVTGLQLQYDFGKKQDSAKAMQDKKDAVSTEVLKRQRQMKNAFIVGFILVFLLALILYNRFRIKRNANVALDLKNKIITIEKANVELEKERSEKLLLNILPAEVAEELKEKGKTEAKNYDWVTVMFTDFKGFTKISEQMSPAKLVAEIDYCFSAFDDIIYKHKIEKIKTIGDAYMCAGGLPVKNNTHAEDTVKAAIEIRDFMANYNEQKIAKGELPFEIRIGINTGPVVAGVVGVRKFAYDIWGDTVNLASRMESSGEAGKVNVSGSTHQLIKDKFHCVHRGKILTKNKGEVDMYFVE